MKRPSRGMPRALPGLLLTTLLLLLTAGVAAAADNDPGHDPLYLEEDRDNNLTGRLNISKTLEVADRMFSTYLDILGNGTVPGGSQNRLWASATDLYLESPYDIIVNGQIGTTAMLRLGDNAGDAVRLNVTGDAYVEQELNVTGDIYTGDTLVQKRVSGTCGAGEAIDTINEDGTVTCQATSGSSSGGGWTNSSTTTSTGLDVKVDTDVFVVNATDDTVTISGSNVCTKANGLCNQSASQGNTTEEIQDAAWGGSILGGTQTGITVTYQDGTDDVDFVVADNYVDTGGDTMSGTLDMDSNIITNIGAAGTDFNSSGGLTLADELSMTNKPILNIGNAGTDFDASGGLTLADVITVSGAGTSAFTGPITVGGNTVCTAANGLCSGASSGGGWTNSSTTTSTGLDVKVDTDVFVVNASTDTVTISGSNVCTKANGLCNQSDVWVDAAGDTMSGTLDMDSNIITNIGAAGTDFNSSGGLTLADELSMTNKPILNIGNTGTDFNSSGGLTLADELTVNSPLRASSGGQEIQIDPAPTGHIEINSSGTTNISITADGGSVIITLG